MDPAELLRSAAPLTQATADMDNPRQHHAWALGSFPAPNKQLGDVPMHPTVQGDLSERLTEFGFRHHPELQTKWVIPGDHPEAGYLNVPKIVDREEYERWVEAHANPDTAADAWRSAAESVLEKVNPALLEQINSMTDEERQAEAARARQHLPAAFERLAELHREGNGEEETQ